ncbi:hypothetical protein CEXT_599011 [Caerostris extrusa]|uniref:Chondroitin sulfate proteoglycan 4 n=1 Tax=Caerostris extrusa TaxID=172846 RepID=A0AAV4PKM0_CAEEX|nr:hypothetical protein CEXT_599011 [Caerostris extrusa]
MATSFSASFPTVEIMAALLLKKRPLFFELNVKYGVFIGGVGGFSELFLGNIPNFRGCIDDVIFNSHDILKKAAASSSSDEHNVFSVTWNCSDEFEALSNQPISFVDKGSFLSLPPWNARNGGSVSLDVKTQTSTAVLFYNAGVPLKSDFISLEILDGKTAVTVNEGNGAVSVQSDITISDGIWHHIDVQFSPSYIEIVIDGHAKNLRPGLGDNRFFDLAGLFYIGGIELNKQARALQDGLQSILIEGAESSLKGCVKNIKINNQLVGFRERKLLMESNQIVLGNICAYKILVCQQQNAIKTALIVSDVSANLIIVFLDTEDPDSQPSDIVYTILNLGSPENEAYFENVQIPDKSTDTFTQADISDNLIAYNNRGAGNVRVTIRVSDGIQSDQSTSVFRISPFDLEITLRNNTGITLPYDSYALILSDNLTFVDNAPDQDLEIRFDVVKLPMHGSLQRLRNKNRWYTVNHFTQRQLKKESLARHKKLDLGSTFTQADINAKRLKYKLHRKSYSSVEDKVELLKIGRSELNIEIPSKSEIIYNITSPPKHGILRRVSIDKNEIEEDSVTVITSTEILQNRLVYVHGDSENERDMFHFIAYAADGNSDSFVYYGTVHILVLMKNDNPPIREVDKIFHVVLDGERKLTGLDLKYVDPDIDSTPADIQYTRREIPNGALFHIDDMATQIYQFTQVDLDTGKIIFRHSGSPYGKAVLRITDGKFYATGILEIKASKPYINITRNTGIVVKREKTGFFQHQI